MAVSKLSLWEDFLSRMQKGHGSGKVEDDMDLRLSVGYGFQGSHTSLRWAEVAVWRFCGQYKLQLEMLFMTIKICENHLRSCKGLKSSATP